MRCRNRILGLRKLLQFADAPGDSVPCHDGFDGGERITPSLLGFQQRLADAPIQAQFVVDGLAQRLELLQTLIPGGIEQLADIELRPSPIDGTEKAT